MNTTVLVTGASGKTGRRIVDRLLARDVTVRSGSRHPETSTAGTPVRFDWDDPATHDPALAGSDAVYVIPPAFVVDPADVLTALFERAASAGVARVVLLSARGVDAHDSIPLRRAELALFATGLDVSAVRPTWFAQNFTEGVFVPSADGVVTAPAGDGRVPFVDAGDIADVAVELLLDRSGRWSGETLELSGAESLSFAEAVRLLGAAEGRDLTFADVSADEFVAGAAAAGVPGDYAGLLAGLLEIVRAGHDDRVSDGVDRVLGRSPRAFSEWVKSI